MRHLGYAADEPAPIIDTILQIVEPDMRLLEHFDVDVVWVAMHEGPIQWGPNRETYQDEFGRRFKLGGGFYNQIEAPLKEGTEEELAHYEFPDMSQHDRTAGSREKARRFYDAGYGVGAAGAWGIYEISSSLRGAENLFLDMALNPEFVEAVAERVLEEHLKPFYSVLLEAIGPWVQMVMVSDDYGGQKSLLFSPEMFRSIYKPRLRRLVDHIRTMTDAKIYIHSDGAIAELIPDFIEIGLDGLNPVQFTARGMAADHLKREFGGELGFFGGGCDNEVLSLGTVEEVRDNVQRQIATLAPGGGYVFTSIHNISQEVPPENIVAFFNAGLEFGQYLGR
ncbi:MAG: uroporphyrinogen decarboxylase family protein [Anaerolineae bacterium]